MKKNNFGKHYCPLIFSFVFCLMLSSLCTQSLATTGTRPGSKNPLPVTKKNIFQDDELLLMVGDPSAHKMNYLSMSPDNNKLDKWKSSAKDHNYLTSEYGMDPAPAIQSCRGRFTRSDREQVAYLLPQADSDHIIMEIWDAEEGRHVHMSIFPVSRLSDRLDVYDISAADIDEVADDKGDFHDEIIIARYYKGKVIIDILKGPFYSDTTVSTITLDAVSIGGEYLASLVVSTGDFNGDGHLEIVVGQSVDGYVGKKGGLIANIIHFDRRDSKLTVDVGPTWKDYVKNGAIMDIATGDFNGNSSDDIALLTGSNIRLLSVDDSWKLHRKSLLQIVYGCEVTAVRIASGLFKFDPGNGFNFSRRQLVFVYTACGSDIEGQIWVIDKDYKVNNTQWNWFDIKTTNQSGLGQDVYFDLTVGNFIGHGSDGKSTSPLEQIAVSYNYNSEESSSEYQNCIDVNNGYCTTYIRQQITLYGIDGDLNKSSTIWKGEKRDYNGTLFTSIIALDSDGDSYVLGNPAHISISDYHSLDYLIQEPPKHIDYLPVTAGVFDGEWELVNVSAYEDFYTELKDEKSTTVKTTSTDTSSHSIGGSASFEVKSTVSGNAVLAGADCSVDAKTKFSYQYDSSKESWNSQYRSREISFDGQAVWDDFLIGSISQLDIWRYPIIGYLNPDSSQPPYGFMEIILPGYYRKISGPGKAVADWYQPVHENGNLLSYPLINDDFPYDLGSFKLPDGSAIHDTMNERTSYNYGGVAQDLSISWSEKSGSGSEKSYKKTLGESTDIKVGVKSKVGVGDIVSSETEVDAEVNFNNKNSWGGSTTSSCVTSESKGITVAVPAGSSDDGYSFMPAIYVTSGTGTLKVAYAVDPTGSESGELWWRNQYGSRPDPALNLPNRFAWHERDSKHLLGYWTFSKKMTRMEMRGFFIRHNDPDKVSGNHELISGPPVDGETVRLCARIYNFALNDPVDDVVVKFESIQLDDGGNEIGKRESIGETTVSLGYIDDGSDDFMKEVWVAWDTTGKASVNGYRFYVTVDPDDKITNELHELHAVATGAEAVDFDVSGKPIKPIHGNNEGFWPWGSGIHVLPKSSTMLQGVAGDEEWLAITGLQIEENGEPISGDKIEVTKGKEYQIRAKVAASSHQTRFVNVLFYEETFSEKRLLASKRISVLASGSSTWFSWIPKELGVSTLSAELVGMDNAAVGPDTDLEVSVHPVQPVSSWQDSILDELLQ